MTQTVNRAFINAALGKVKIDRHIYGHFAEHLGRCIYEGIWVGEDSPIPNTRGIRNDIVQALRQIRIPNLRWPGGCFRPTLILTGRHCRGTLLTQSVLG